MTNITVLIPNNVKNRNLAFELSNANVLLVEDDQDITNLVKLHLEDQHASVTHCDNGARALDLALNDNWDLIILDLQLPKLSGLDVCRKLRAERNLTPIIMVTAKTSELDRVLGLELGADDYVSKPFSPAELMARVRALLRRASISRANSHASTLLQHEQDQKKALNFGSININLQRHQVTVEQKHVDLTSKEFDLLLYFARHPGHVFRRSDLLDKVWGYGHAGYEHTVNSHINRLRRKIELNPADPKHIITVWGVGYKFDVPAQ